MSADYPLVQSIVPVMVLARVASWYMLTNLRIYAKARHLSLPVNFLTFAVMSGVIFMLRRPYSLWLVTSCRIATCATSYVLAAVTRFGSKR